MRHFHCFRLSFNMTAQVVVRGEVEIRKGIDGLDLDDALVMLDGILMQVCYVGNNNLIKRKRQIITWSNR